MSGGLWRLSAEGAAGRLRAAYDRLAAAEETAEAAAALSLSLTDRGADRAVLEALFPTAPDAGAFLRAAGLERAALDHLHIAPLPDEDWVALSLAGLKPVTAGRFLLYGAHDAAEVQSAPSGAIPILIEANQAFGTGHHGTTRGCLLAFDALLAAGADFNTVLDLGCGSGALAIAAAKALPDARVMASDNDPLAVAVTQENLAANSVSGAETIVAEGLDHPGLASRAPYDLIFANILAGPLIVLAPAIADALAPGGRVILSGLLTEQRGAVLAAYEAAGLSLESEGALDGWSALVARRGE